MASHLSQARVEITSPKDGEDLLFEAFAPKTWHVRARVSDFAVGVDVGYACVYLDGAYKACRSH
jgi:hypothetical protein